MGDLPSGENTEIFRKGLIKWKKYRDFSEKGSHCNE
jgi:hypothetical protein